MKFAVCSTGVLKVVDKLQGSSNKLGNRHLDAKKFILTTDIEAFVPLATCLVYQHRRNKCHSLLHTTILQIACQPDSS
jgi:hypothetical protein